MNAVAETVTPTDDIRILLGPIGDDDYEQRRRIRTCRNVASFRVTRTESPTARTLLWIAAEYGVRYVYGAADLGTLTEVATFARRLLMLADTAETLEGAAND